VSPGHKLILPKRHIASIFEATKEEVAASWETLQQTRTQLLKEFLMGSTSALTAVLQQAKTILHLHIHIIQRYGGATCPIRTAAFGGYFQTRPCTGRIDIFAGECPSK
jgi:diadenosine tetraphosphate (Ap4A) HIT family hydrolase